LYISPPYTTPSVPGIPSKQTHCARLWLAALDSGVRDPIAILTRWAVGLHRADLAALIAATREVGTDGARDTSACAAGCTAHATNATPVIVPAAATEKKSKHKNGDKNYKPLSIHTPSPFPCVI